MGIPVNFLRELWQEEENLGKKNKPVVLSTDQPGGTKVEQSKTRRSRSNSDQKSKVGKKKISKTQMREMRKNRGCGSGGVEWISVSTREKELFRRFTV